MNAVVIGGMGNIGSAVWEKLKANGYQLDEQWIRKPRLNACDYRSYKKLPKVIHLAVYLPGYNVTKPLQNLNASAWDRIIEVNLRGAYLFARYAFPALKEGKGTFVTVSSILATHPYPERVAYAAAKGGLEAFTRALAVEWGEYGINTHCIRLGHLDSWGPSWPKNPTVLDAVKNKTPGKRLVTREDVASYIVWLASEGAKAVNGTVIDFDPGYCINRWPL